MNDNCVTIEQVQKLYEFLQGNAVDGFIFSDPPKLSKDTAVDIIYYLQEKMHIIPDTYESCKKCGDFFDSDDGCLAGFCDCCGCQHSEFVNQEDGCITCEESLCSDKEGGHP